MINEYFYEIIAVIIFLTAIVIYFLNRKFTQEELNDFEQTPPLKNEVIIEPYTKSSPMFNEKIVKKEKVQEETVDSEQDEAFTLEGYEEGSFGDIQNNPFEEDTPPPEPKKKPRQKCEVPSHGKISKENFKDFKGVKLLVAEDNFINQKVINGLLDGTGIEVTMADDGQIALDILEKNNDFDMVLMDANMPNVDGFEATRRIRSNPKYENIVVVALSGDTAADDIRKMVEAGMEEQLEKPLRMDAFYDVLYAYTKSATSETNSEFIDVIMTKELNGDKGLQVCGGDESFYKDILHQFTDNYTHASRELLELLKRKDKARADALLLDFIGVTANIGADNIRKIALELKEAIKDLEEDSYITILDDFEVHLEILLKDIAAYK